MALKAILSQPLKTPQPFLNLKSRSLTPFLSFPTKKPYSSSSSNFNIPEYSSLSANLNIPYELYECLPIQNLRGKAIVVKYGGPAIKPFQEDNLLASFIKDLVLLSHVGLRPVLVVGGGLEINLWLKCAGVEPVFSDGLCSADSNAMDFAAATLPDVSRFLATLIGKAGGTAVLFAGYNGLFKARPTSPVQMGFNGDVHHVNPKVIKVVLEEGHIPVICSVGFDDEFTRLYSVNPDAVAGELAAALGSEKLILLTEVAGILENPEDPTSLIKNINVQGVKKMLESGKLVNARMTERLKWCIRSINKGVMTASVINGFVENILMQEIMTNGGAGTMITR